MDIRKSHGKNIVCAHIFPVEGIKLGSDWMGSGGEIVTVIKIKDDWITYTWRGADEVKVRHEKDSFSFQCRYCLIVK